MRPEPHRLRFAGLAAALASLAALAACGGGSDASSDVPVEEQLGLEQEGILARQAAAENIIADCMKAQGFDYVPVDPQAQRAALVGQAGMSEEDFNQQFGYGITTLFGKEESLPPGPNEEIRNALSEADQAAYDRALYGDDTTATFANALDTGDYTRLGGCTQQAVETVFGGVGVFQSLQEKLDELDSSIIEDERMVDAISAWSQCMRDAGFDLADPEQVDVVLLAELEGIAGPPDNPNAEIDQAALAALQAKEVAMVNADIACEEEHIRPVEEEVRAEYEVAFREENADLLTQVPAP